MSRGGNKLKQDVGTQQLAANRIVSQRGAEKNKEVPKQGDEDTSPKSPGAPSAREDDDCNVDQRLECMQHGPAWLKNGYHGESEYEY